MLLREAVKYTNLLTIVFLWCFSCDGAARPSATPSRQRRAGVNEDTAETSVLRGLARLNRPNLADKAQAIQSPSFQASIFADDNFCLYLITAMPLFSSGCLGSALEAFKTIIRL